MDWSTLFLIILVTYLWAPAKFWPSIKPFCFDLKKLIWNDMVQKFYQVLKIFELWKKNFFSKNFCFFRTIWQKTQKIRKNETICYGKEIVAMLENFWALVENFYFLYCTTDWLTSKFCRCLPICWCM